MHKKKSIFRNVLLCFFAAMLSVSCLLEKDGPSPDMRGVMIQLNVSADGMTKAVYEDPEDAEKAIRSLRVYAFSGERLAGYVSRQDTEQNESFYMDLELPASGTHDIDFYLIANEEEMAYENGLVQISENMTKTELKALRFTGLVNRTMLPMYCDSTVAVNVDAVSADSNTAPGHEGHYILSQTVEFALKRSLAKLSVYAAKTAGAEITPQILGVDLLAKGTREYSYLFPQADDVLDAVHTRANNRQFVTSAVNVYKAVAKGTAAQTDPANYTEVVGGVYIPEVREGVPYDDPSYRWDVYTGDIEDESRSAVLHVEYSLGEGEEIRNGYIYLPCIERNDHVKVCILINAEGQITVNYVVADWEWNESSMNNWFFDYPTHSYLRHDVPNSEEELDDKPADKAIMSESEPFVGYFSMTYPETDKWTPTFTGLNAPKCDVKVYNDRTDELLYDSSDESKMDPIDVSEDWYRIEVLPKVGMDIGDTVNLSITYTLRGFDVAEFLLINGSYGNYFWPGSTDANFVTITMVI